MVVSFLTSTFKEVVAKLKVKGVENLPTAQLLSIFLA